MMFKLSTLILISILILNFKLINCLGRNKIINQFTFNKAVYWHWFKYEDTFVHIDDNISIGENWRSTSLEYSNDFIQSLLNGDIQIPLNNYGNIIYLKGLNLYSRIEFHVIGTVSSYMGNITLNSDSELYIESGSGEYSNGVQNGYISHFKLDNIQLFSFSELHFTGESKILFDCKSPVIVNFGSNVKFNGAKDVEITNYIHLLDDSSISLVNSNVAVYQLPLSRYNDISISLHNSKLSIQKYSDQYSNNTDNFTYAPQNFVLENDSVFSYNHNYHFDGTNITITNSSIIITDSTTKVDTIINGNSFSFILNNSILILLKSIDCEDCKFILKNRSTLELGNNIILSMNSANTTNKLISRLGNIYGNGTLYIGDGGLEIESGTIGINNEISKLDIYNDVIIKNGSKIQLYIKSEMEYSLLNIINGTLDFQIGSNLEIYIDFKFANSIYYRLNDVKITIIKTSNESISLNLFAIHQNISIYIADPSTNEIIPNTNFKLSVNSNDNTISLERSSVINHRLVVGISIGSFVAVCLLVISVVWFKVIRNRISKTTGMKQMNDDE